MTRDGPTDRLIAGLGPRRAVAAEVNADGDGVSVDLPEAFAASSIVGSKRVFGFKTVARPSESCFPENTTRRIVKLKNTRRPASLARSPIQLCCNPSPLAAKPLAQRVQIIFGLIDALPKKGLAVWMASVRSTGCPSTNCPPQTFAALRRFASPDAEIPANPMPINATNVGSGTAVTGGSTKPPRML